MYTVIYLYRLNEENKQPFLDINDKISEILLDYGTLEDKIYYADDLDRKNGCEGLLTLIAVAKHEQVFFGQSVFRNKSHYEDVMEHVNKNDEMKDLMNQLKEFVDYSKTFTGSFKTPD